MVACRDNKRRLDALMNKELSSVVFVRDYVQLVFEGDANATLTCFRFPVVNMNQRLFELTTPGYRDVLCSCIGNIVVNATVDDDLELSIVMSNNRSIWMSLKEADRNGPEAAMLDDGSHLSVW